MNMGKYPNYSKQSQHKVVVKPKICYICGSLDNLEKHYVCDDKGRFYPQPKWLCPHCRKIQWARSQLASYGKVYKSDHPEMYKHLCSVAGK